MGQYWSGLKIGRQRDMTTLFHGQTRITRKLAATFYSFAAALLFGLLLLTPAQAQTYGETYPPQSGVQVPGNDASVQERLERLERDFLDLQQDYYENGPQRSSFEDDGSVSESLAGRMTLRMEEFEATLRRLTGQLEQINHSIRLTADRVDRLSGDVEYRLQALEGGGGGTPVASASAPRPTAPRPSTVEKPKSVEIASGPTPEGTLGTLATSALPQGEEEQYKAAYDLLYRGDYAGGESALKAFLASHPDSQYAGNAQYWLGESYYARRQYREAAQAFLVGVQKYKKSEKAPDSMLKLGLSLINLGETKDGCSALKSIKSQFPKVRQSVINTAKRERKKAGC